MCITHIEDLNKYYTDIYGQLIDDFTGDICEYQNDWYDANEVNQLVNHIKIPWKKIEYSTPDIGSEVYFVTNELNIITGYFGHDKSDDYFDEKTKFFKNKLFSGGSYSKGEVIGWCYPEELTKTLCEIM